MLQIAFNVFHTVLRFTSGYFKSAFVDNSTKLDFTLMSNCLLVLHGYMSRFFGHDMTKQRGELSSTTDELESLVEGIFVATTMSHDAHNQFDNLVLAKLSRNSTSSELVAQSLQRIVSNNLSYFPSLLSPRTSSACAFCFLATLMQLEQLCIRQQLKPFGSSECAPKAAAFLDNPYVKSYLKHLIGSNDETTRSVASSSYILFKYECNFAYSYLKLSNAISDIQVEFSQNSQFETQ